MKDELKRKIERLGREARIEMAYQNGKSSISRSYARADRLYREMEEARAELNKL